MKSLGLVGASCLAATLTVWVAAAQEQAPQQPAQPAQSWTVACAGAAGQAELTCTMRQELIVKDKNQRVLTAVVLKRNGKMLLNLALPHGLNLPKGVTVWIDQGAKKTYPILTADQQGSYSTVDLDETMLTGLKQGTTLNVAVSAFTGDEVVLQLTLAGFTAGIAKL